MNKLIPDSDKHLEKMFEDEFEWSVKNNQTVRFHKIISELEVYYKDKFSNTKNSGVAKSDDTEIKNLLKAIYVAGAIGSHRNLSDDVAAVRRLV